MNLADMVGKIHCGDCREVMKEMPDNCVDLVLTDPPYGITALKWDVVPDLARLWEGLKRIGKPNCAYVFTASQPFTTDLINSNRKMFKYCWYWEKSKPNGFQHAANRPLYAIEDIVIFSMSPMGHISLLGEKRMKYNPQNIKNGVSKIITKAKHGRTLGGRPNQVGKHYESKTNYPINILRFANVIGISALHPTQKPLALMKYLILTYSNPGDLVFDGFCGSGTTAVACAELDRRFIGIEISQEYCDIAQKRVDAVQNQTKLKLETE